MDKKINFEEVETFLNKQSTATKIYIGADSERYSVDNRWYADYTLAIVVHIDGKHGCKVFGEVQTEPDYDSRADRPSIRLMNEVFKVAELYQKLIVLAGNKNIEVHLDINPDPSYNSNSIIQQAVGYIRGVCNVDPVVKPKAFAASYCADRLKEILDQSQVEFVR